MKEILRGSCAILLSEVESRVDFLHLSYIYKGYKRNILNVIGGFNIIRESRARRRKINVVEKKEQTRARE